MGMIRNLCTKLGNTHKGKRIPVAVRKEMTTLHEEGWTFEDIAEQVELSIELVGQYLERRVKNAIIYRYEAFCRCCSGMVIFEVRDWSEGEAVNRLFGSVGTCDKCGQSYHGTALFDPLDRGSINAVNGLCVDESARMALACKLRRAGMSIPQIAERMDLTDGAVGHIFDTIRERKRTRSKLA